jgi:CHAT domain-containing protein
MVLGRPRRALHHFEAARRGCDPDARARMAPEVATVLALLGRTDEALRLLASARRHLAACGAYASVAHVESTVGALLRRLDENEKALRHLSRARRAFLRAGLDGPVAATDTARANAYTNLFHFARAERLYRRCAEHFRSRGQIATALQVEYNHAYLAFYRGRFQDSLARFAAVQREFAKLGDERHVALCDLDRAEVCLRLNLDAEAHASADRAHGVFERLGMQLEAARARFFRAVAARRQHRRAEAEEGLHAARAAFRTLGCEAWEAIALHRLAELDRDTGNAGRAASRAAEAAQRLRRLGLVDRAGSAELLLATIELESHEPDAARRRAQAVLDAMAGLHAPWVSCEAHHVLARCQAILGRAAPAVRHALRAVRLLERHRIAVPPDEFMSAFLRDKAAVYEDAVSFVLWLGGRRAHRVAFEVAERAKGRALLDRLHAAPPAPTPRTRRLVREAQELTREIDGLLGRMPEAATGTRSAEDGRRREAAAIRERRLALCLESLGDPATARDGARTSTLDELSAALSDDTTLVEFFLARDTLLAFVVRRGDLHVHAVPVNRDAVRHTLARMRFQLDRPEAFTRPDAALEHSLERSARSVLSDLHALLVEPIRGALTTRRIVFVPHRELHGVPFHALERDGRALLDDHEVVVAPSTSVYLHCLRAPAPTSGPALLVGVPDVGAPLIADEILGLARLHADAAVLLGPKATRRALRGLAGRAGIVHVASHAEHRRDDPMLSGIRLADGWLTVADVAAMRLAPRVLILSGCATAEVAPTEGDDVFGVPRGFLQAGAASIVSSLWRVSDDATALFMERLHEALAAGRGVAAAAREAALAVRAVRPHPHHWAPFIVLGRDRPSSPTSAQATVLPRESWSC